MRIWATLLLAIVLCACADGKMGEVAVPLAGAVNRQYIINIDTIYASQLPTEERRFVEANYAPLIQKALAKRGYKTHLASQGTPPGISLTLSGQVTRYDPGDEASRVMVGFGAGSSHLYTSFTLDNYYTEDVVTQFEIIATSGGNSGLQSLGSYLETHLEDGANKVAEYLAGRARR